ncbi:MAG: VWA domain-containing protein [Ruminococcus sp.]|nr:VWA domain-containing protein [Ruminococcus sp.]
MKIKRIIVASVTALSFLVQTPVCVFATEGVQPLQTYFTDDGKSLKVFTSEALEDDAYLLIGNESFVAETIISDVKVHTTFLVDNSTSMPYNLREDIKTAITNYVSGMSDSESVKIALFDTHTTVLADEYSADKEFISYELSKIDFNGQASLVYDSVLEVSENTDTSVDAYYRTVLITDGIDSVEGTSFDYLRSVISENGRYHVDVVQVSESDNQDVNLKAIASLGSNTYTYFKSGSDFEGLNPDNVSMIKVNLNNSVTTGELKGVTIKNGGTNISLGSILFPQVEIDDPEPIETTIVSEITTVITSETTKKSTTVSDTLTTTLTVTDSSPTDGEKKNFPIILIIAIISGCFLIGAIVAIIVFKKNKKIKQCCIAVQICKDDQNDQKGVGDDMWKFPVNSEFRVGRIIDPKSNTDTPLPKNHRAICEEATNEDISSIGRNAFLLTCNKKTRKVTIKNVAQSAIFSVETENRKNDLRTDQTDTIKKGTKILLGNYTTVIIRNITINNS